MHFFLILLLGFSLILLILLIGYCWGRQWDHLPHKGWWVRPFENFLLPFWRFLQLCGLIFVRLRYEFKRHFRSS